MTVFTTFVSLSNVPQYNVCMLFVRQMLCVPAFQLPVGTAVKINTQDMPTSIICLGLRRTAFSPEAQSCQRTHHNTAFQHITSVRLHWSCRWYMTVLMYV